MEKHLLKRFYTPIKTSHYSYQSGGWEWCAINRNEDGKYYQLTGWTSCKDYLNELMWAQHTKKIVRTCTIDHNPVGTPWKIDKFRIGVRIENISYDAEACFRSALTVIRYVEKKFGITRKCYLRKLYKENEPQSTENTEFIFEASNKWLKAPPISSLFMFITRCCLNYNEDTHGKDIEKYLLSTDTYEKTIKYMDYNYMKSAIKSGNFKKLLNKGLSLFFKKSEDNYKLLCSVCKEVDSGSACCLKYTNYNMHSYGFNSWTTDSASYFEKLMKNGKDLYELREKE